MYWAGWLAMGIIVAVFVVLFGYVKSILGFRECLRMLLGDCVGS